MTLDPNLWSPPVAIAHRGSRLLWPENTMTAFTGAAEMGYVHLETDLRSTADGVLVCFHDATVDRTTDGRGPLASLTYEEVRRLDAGFRHATPGGHGHRGKGVRVPSFEEVVTGLPDARFVVDLKADGLERPLAGLVKRLGIHDRLIVGSFSDARLARFREVTAGAVPISTGPTWSRLWFLASRVGRSLGGRASALQVPRYYRGVRVVDRRLLDTAHASGLQVHVWTVNRVDEMESLLDLGVDGLVTDRPDLLKDVLTRRGEWLGR